MGRLVLAKQNEEEVFLIKNVLTLSCDGRDYKLTLANGSISGPILGIRTRSSSICFINYDNSKYTYRYFFPSNVYDIENDSIYWARFNQMVSWIQEQQVRYMSNYKNELIYPGLKFYKEENNITIFSDGTEYVDKFKVQWISDWIHFIGEKSHLMLNSSGTMWNILPVPTELEERYGVYFLISVAKDIIEMWFKEIDQFLK